jgi:hypothetical protein
MSTNDDSASRRGRRADQGGSGWPATTRRQREEGWDQAPSGNRDSGAQQAAYSGFTRPSYSQRQEPAPQPPPRSYESPPAQQPYYQDPAPRQEAYDPPPPQHLGYGDGGRDDLFTRDAAPQAYDSNPYNAQAAGYQQPYDQGRAQPAPSQDYYQQRSDRSYAPAQPYNQGNYSGQRENYDQHGGYDSRYEPQESWHGDEQGYHAGEEQGRHLVPAHGDEFDQDFFGDEDDYEHDDVHGTSGGGRKKFIAAAVAAALAAGGGAYYLKTSGGDKATPVIRADTKPSKEVPGNPGGKQFPNSDKTIYERLRPDGSTQVSSPAAPGPVTQAQASPPPPAGNSLEDRIDEALRKVHRGGEAPAGRSGGTDQPTVVRSESYRPDGTRMQGQPVITPTISDASSGLPYPFGNAPASPTGQPAPAAAPPAQFRPAAAPPPQQQVASMMPPAPPPVKGQMRTARQTPPPAEPAPAAAPAVAGGFYVSLKSAPDEKAIQKDLPALTDKYKSVLGDVQLSTKIADLGAKGVTYRAVAGPLGTKQEAQDLCQKIKGVAGDKACFVTN